jgi:tetratricopeptide (TPR) repeat protein
VDDGAVIVSSPAGGPPQELAKGEHAGVPLHAAVASTPLHAEPHRVSVRPRRSTGPLADPKAEKVPDWLARYNANDPAGALALLGKHGGVDAAIAGAHNANELMAIADLMRSKGNDTGAAVRAYNKVLDAYPGDQQAYFAASGLEKAYLRMDQRDEAQQNHDRALALAPDAVLCTDTMAEVNKTEAARLAKMYLDRYPHGQCREAIEKMLQGGDAPAGADPAPGASASADPPAPPAP